MTELVDFITDLLTGAQVVALSLAVGGIVWGLLVLRPWRCRSDASAGVRPCLGLVLAGAFALALAQTVELALRAWILAEALGRSPFPSLLHTPLFQAGIARAFGAGALGAAAAWLRRRPGVVLRRDLAGAGRHRVRCTGGDQGRAPRGYAWHGGDQLPGRPPRGLCRAPSPRAAAGRGGGGLAARPPLRCGGARVPAARGRHRHRGRPLVGGGRGLHAEAPPDDFADPRPWCRGPAPPA